MRPAENFVPKTVIFVQITIFPQRAIEIVLTAVRLTPGVAILLRSE